MSGSQRSPNPAVTAFFRSTKWKLLLAAEAATVVGGAIGYYLTNNLLAYTPFAAVALILVLTLYRLIKQGAATSGAGDDSIVK